MSANTLLLAATTSFAVALVITPLLRRMSIRFGLLDVPNDRSSHVVPTPRSGGVAILAGIVAASVAFHATQERAMVVILAAAIFVATFSFIDDVKHIRPSLRFVLQILAAAVAVFVAGAKLSSLALPYRDVPLGIVGAVLSIFWIAGVINANNFMDGINGIAAVQAIVASVAVGAMLCRAGDMHGAVLAAALAGATAGFLPWNFPSGKIFMGDVGSASIGFLLGALILRASAHTGIIAAALPFFPFLFDSTWTLIRRARRGDRLSVAHREHLYQRLTQLTGTHAVATVTWGALAVVCSIAAMMYESLPDPKKIALLAVILAIHVAVAGYVTRRERA